MTINKHATACALKLDRYTDLHRHHFRYLVSNGHIESNSRTT